MVQLSPVLESGLTPSFQILSANDATQYANGLAGIDNTRYTFLQTSQIVECKLDATDSSKADFGFAAATYRISSELMIAFLYLNQQNPAESVAVNKHVQQTNNASETLLNMPPLVTSQGTALQCNSIPKSSIVTSIEEVYRVLDGDVDNELNSSDVDAAISTLEQARDVWDSQHNPESCSSQIRQMSFLTDNLLDETLIAALYMKLGNTVAFTAHAKLAVESAQYINGFLS